MRNGAVLAATLALFAARSMPCAAQAAFTPGTSLDRDIHADEEQRYTVALGAGDAARFEIYGDLVMSVTLVRPDGSTSLLMASLSDQLETVTMTVLARDSGNYSLLLHMRATESTGSYRLGFVEMHPEDESDRQRARSEALVQDGLRLFKDTRAEARREAAERLRESLTIWRALKDSLREAVTLSQLGRVYNRLGEPRAASEFYAEARDRFHELGNRLEEASMLNNLGLEYMNLGEYPRAVETLRQSAALFHELGHRSGERSPHNNLGLTYIRMGELEKGQEQYSIALALARETKDRSGEAYAFSGLAGIAIESGRFQEALDDTSRALEIFRSLSNRQLEAQMLGYLGSIHVRLGEPEIALDYLLQAQKVGELAPNRTRDAAILGSITVAYTRLGDTAKAMTFATRYRDAWRELGNKAQEADADIKIADLDAKLSHIRDAADTYTRAKTLAHESAASSTEALALIGLSRVQLQQQAPAEALRAAREAVDIAARAGLRLTGEQALASLARVEMSVDDLTAARGHLEDALTLAESVRASVAGPDLRTSYFTSVREQYEWLIDVLMRMHRQHPALGFDARAFEASERARARALLELLGESQSRILEGIDPGLLDREERTRAALAGRLDAPGSALESRLAEYRKVQNEIRASSPRYAALTQPQPGGLDDIRRDVLDGETTLVEYALGEERSYVWVITQRAIAGHELAPRSVIEAAARRAYDALAGPNSPESREPLSVLSRLVLQPIAGGVTTRRVAIVTEGALQYIPFATLPDASGRPLVAANEIVSLPSASTLQVLRREFTSRPPASQALFVVGDPVFDGHDSRVRAPEAVPKAGAGAVERSARESGVNQLERLYFTRREADSIASLGRRGQTRELVDFDANLDRLMETEVSAYRFVHLATHGLLNNRHPELSGLVFSLVDRQGRPRNGFLPASDVYNLRLNADLVVLSACQTALGGDVRGEGLVGLTRAFMYAGAPRVVSSLWRVPDNATAVLMQQFYRRMLVDHAQPAAALRAAQLAVRSEPRWSAPYYWAGFILQGEWR